MSVKNEGSVMRNLSEREQSVLGCLSCLPKNILAMHHLENITEFVLHDLCHERCFNLEKAAYLVDNPDFDCCKGIAGFLRTPSSTDQEDIWQDPETFSLFMRSCPFNSQVRNFESPSIARNGLSEKEAVDRIARELAFHTPGYLSWNMKHDNHGMLIFEHGNGEIDDLEQHLLNSVHFFGFCPIF